MAKPLVSDALWERVEPLLPPPKPRRRLFPGRKPLDPRKVLSGIIFVLRTGIDWEELPAEPGWGCGKTCKAYLQAWQAAGVWERLHAVLLAELRGAEEIDWSRAAAGSTQARALGGGDETGPNPTDRGKPGTKYHTLTGARGIPLAVTVTGANVPDVNELIPLVDAVPPVAGAVGHPKQRPDELYADRAYDSDPHREELEARGIDPKVARRGTEHGSGLGIYRGVVERTESWLLSFRKLRVRADRKGEVHQGLVALAKVLIGMWFI
jgi:transposase